MFTGNTLGTVDAAKITNIGSLYMNMGRLSIDFLPTQYITQAVGKISPDFT
jgi:hypothetical protein